MNKGIILGLFFTKGASLEMWLKSGLFDREKKIYERLIEGGYVGDILWFTYGVNDDVLARDLVRNKRLNEKIRVICMPKMYSTKIMQWLYSFIILFVHFRIVKTIDILKTNQIYGAWAPLIIKLFLFKPLIVRCGYVPSESYNSYDNYRDTTLKHKFIRYLMRKVEFFAFKFSDLSVVSNQIDFDYVRKNYKVDNIRINPSYVDESHFFSVKNAEIRNTKRILYVGRLHDIKNIVNTIDGVIEAGFAIDIYGDGHLKDYIQSNYKSLISENLINLMGIVPNDELASLYRKYQFYILMSYKEGMSKTLIEAMTSGLVCIVSDIPQNTAIIVDGQTGLVVKGFESSDIAKKLNTINTYNLEEISKKTIRFAQDNYTLSKVCINEVENINALL